MNKNKIFFGLSALMLIVGMSANAGKITGKSSAADSVKSKTDSVEEVLAKVPESSIVDEVIWVVGDEPILKSDVEAMRLQSDLEGVKWSRDPDCAIPEQLAVQKLFLHQAAIDSIEVSESDVASGIDQQVNYWIQQIGSREKLEEYRGQSITQIRQQMHDDYKNHLLIQKMQQEITKNIKVTPADVRAYFKNMPEDSIPYVQTEVEVEIITRNPKIPQTEINRVKDQLREFTDRVTKGETTFATLARLYSEDPGTARQGGELDYTGRGMLDPAFANVAFNLTDPKKISKIVETEFGYHIIQLIDKRGDKIKVRHILLKPQVSQEAMAKAEAQLDSISNDIRANKFSFADAASFLSDDKNTKNNHGLMYNSNSYERTSRFKMKDLPTEVARQVENMKVGEVSNAFEMVNDKGKKVCAIIRLKNRTDGHKATISGDFQVMKAVVENKEREKVIHDWVVNKIKKTYVRMDDRYKNCDFEYEGWIK
jgi:peptidyl-prolyl cis-trans isomerase SurA